MPHTLYKTQGTCSQLIDWGCGSVLIVFLLTLAGWVPGVIAALVILNKN